MAQPPDTPLPPLLSTAAFRAATQQARRGLDAATAPYRQWQREFEATLAPIRQMHRQIAEQMNFTCPAIHEPLFLPDDFAAGATAPLDDVDRADQPGASKLVKPAPASVGPRGRPSREGEILPVLDGRSDKQRTLRGKGLYRFVRVALHPELTDDIISRGFVPPGLGDDAIDKVVRKLKDRDNRK